LDAREIEQLAETQTWLTHQPRSNMNNAVGVAQVEAMLRMGVKVGLGNDGFSNAMWEEWKACYLVHKLNHSDPRRMPADVIVQMAVINNRELVKCILPDAEVGILKVGADADLIFVDYLPFTDVTEGNLPWHIVFGMQESMITSTMVHGKFLMKDRKLTTLDEEKIAFDAKKLSHKVWERFNWISQERMNR
jgi:cytosine/adenosine deaminase-related metal-dependent hydrolase